MPRTSQITHKYLSDFSSALILTFIPFMGRNSLRWEGTCFELIFTCFPFVPQSPTQFSLKACPWLSNSLGGQFLFSFFLLLLLLLLLSKSFIKISFTCNEYQVVYGSVESLNSIPGTNITLAINYTGI